ncbi:MAG: hypothetical protein ACJAQT_001725 [Akkermansiaceae bacterium]|jgi:hypothetical protein
MKSMFVALSSLLPLTVSAVEFEKPLQLRAGDTPIQVEAPGFAAPLFTI